MNLKSVLSGPDIHQGIRDFGNRSGAVLMDVRTPEEYGQGHIPGSINIPLQNMVSIESQVEDKETPIYVYCHSGARSRRAAVFLGKLGYSDVQNIGGLAAYSGELVR